MFTETERATMNRQSATVDKLGPGLGEGTFVETREFFVQLARQRKLEHGVAKKFQTLVMLNGCSQLMRNRRVCEREPKLV